MSNRLRNCTLPYCFETLSFTYLRTTVNNYQIFLTRQLFWVRMRWMYRCLVFSWCERNLTFIMSRTYFPVGKSNVEIFYFVNWNRLRSIGGINSQTETQISKRKIFIAIVIGYFVHAYRAIFLAKWAINIFFWQTLFDTVQTNQVTFCHKHKPNFFHLVQLKDQMPICVFGRNKYRQSLSSLNTFRWYRWYCCI